MTTARRNVVKEDGVTRADPFDFGAGHIVPNKAIDPGLVYDAGLFDYLAGTCGTDAPLVSPDDCDFLESLGFSLDPSDLNLPSIGVGGPARHADRAPHGDQRLQHAWRPTRRHVVEPPGYHGDGRPEQPDAASGRVGDLRGHDRERHRTCG